jgi:hypothetical protein
MSDSHLVSRSTLSWLTLGFALWVTACGTPDAPQGPDSAQMAQASADSLAKAALVEAAALRDSAQATLATLLKNPASASFDSVVVMQPPADGDRRPPMVVCGRISGTPGIGGRSTPTRFVFQTKFALFVEEAANAAAFAQLLGRTCGAPGARVVLQ